MSREQHEREAPKRPGDPHRELRRDHQAALL